MEELERDVYCLFCIAGGESSVVRNLDRLGYQAISPVVLKWKPVDGQLKKRPCRLLPGYIFFEAGQDNVPDWSDIRAIRKVLRILQYDDGTRALREADYEFVQWLKRYSGVIDVSQAVQEGTKIRFVNGPLKDLGGTIVKVNKSRKQVAVNLGSESAIKIVWCGIEYVEAEKEG
ncbi:MAG TPA: transcription termination/antitermination NusG family protein [Clostridia bacterium]|nr:MAG: transcription antitermination protein NusG [Firmicutes bacterium ADurb.Bin248]HOG01112.1 transcription termination/antitermination NusG family protein [Clostridia bacterium]HOS18901.1 transcription termination/antitermination NusG family protein [Clostridia bacterium]HPK16775.1 transcription termination/antitermination NusG family protein [Clostridia bacterium]